MAYEAGHAVKAQHFLEIVNKNDWGLGTRGIRVISE